MSFEFKYGGKAHCSKDGNDIDYDSWGSGSADDIRVESKLAESIAEASSRALSQAIDSVSKKKRYIDYW